jgi:hypothetical protein
MSTEKSAFWRGILVGGAFMLLTSVAAGRLFDTRVVEVASIIPQDVIEAYNTGRTDALRTNPVSADLEMTCLELWDRKQ